MKHYHIETDGRQSPPYTYEQLKSYGITRKTLVWTEGMTGWKLAGSLEELQGLFPTPPPAFSPAAEPIKVPKRSFISKNGNKILAASLVCVFAIFLFYSFSDTENAETNNTRNAARIERQQKAIDAQKEKIAEQERLRHERAEKERLAVKVNKSKKLR